MSRSGNRLDCKWSVYLIPLLTTKCRSLSHLKKRGHCVYERFVPAETSYLGLIIGLLGQTLMKPRVVHHWVIIYNQKLTANTMLYSISSVLIFSGLCDWRCKDVSKMMKICVWRERTLGLYMSRVATHNLIFDHKQSSFLPSRVGICHITWSSFVNSPKFCY